MLHILPDGHGIGDAIFPTFVEFPTFEENGISIKLNIKVHQIFLF